MYLVYSNDIVFVNTFDYITFLVGTIWLSQCINNMSHMYIFYGISMYIFCDISMYDSVSYAKITLCIAIVLP